MEEALVNLAVFPPFLGSQLAHCVLHQCYLILFRDAPTEKCPRGEWLRGWTHHLCLVPPGRHHIPIFSHRLPKDGAGEFVLHDDL